MLDSEIYLTGDQEFRMKMLTKTQIKVILILLDNRGHAEWEIAEYLGKEDSNLNPILKDLEKMGIIYRGESRLPKKQHKKEGDYREIPYYLGKNLDNLKKVIEEIIQSERRETWFIFRLIGNSKYLKSLRTRFKDNADIVIKDELQKSKIFSDDFYSKIMNQNERFCRPGPDPIENEIEYWYYTKYLHY
jgi:predicted transcriptional regulator